ncbi:hypothetical protein M405DRAFT_845508 [Rhizopogon salebrosus TDB-379]|nr:hypothetical protein M405DRAFT_845508 [Rhizopogon salebrosus TDB-379]
MFIGFIPKRVVNVHEWICLVGRCHDLDRGQKIEQASTGNPGIRVHPEPRVHGDKLSTPEGCSVQGCQRKQEREKRLALAKRKVARKWPNRSWKVHLPVNTLLCEDGPTGNGTESNHKAHGIGTGALQGLIPISAGSKMTEPPRCTTGRTEKSERRRQKFRGLTWVNMASLSDTGHSV